MKRSLLAGLSLVLVAAPFSASARVAAPAVYVADGKAKGSVELVGHSPLDNRGMNAGLAVRGNRWLGEARYELTVDRAEGATVERPPLRR